MIKQYIADNLNVTLADNTRYEFGMTVYTFVKEINGLIAIYPNTWYDKATGFIRSEGDLLSPSQTYSSTKNAWQAWKQWAINELKLIEAKKDVLQEAIRQVNQLT